jgi:hypothetical protein
VYPYSRPGPTPTRVTIDLRADGRAIIRYPREPSPNEAAWVFTAPDTLRFDLRTLGFGTSSASYRVTQAGDRVTLELLRGVPGVLLPQTRTIALKRMAPGPASTAALIPPGLSVTLRDAGAAPESKLMGFRAQTRARELAGPGWTQASSIEMRRVMLRHTSGRADEKLVWVVVLRDITTYSHGPDPNPGGRLSTRVIVFDANTGAEEFGTSWGGGYVAP